VEEYLNISESSRYVGCSPVTIKRRISKGDLPLSKDEKGRKQIAKKDLDRVFGQRTDPCQVKVAVLEKEIEQLQAEKEKLQIQLEKAEDREQKLWAMLENK
jgi:hypothetical protein